MKENIINIKSFNFAIRTIKLYQYLIKTHKEYTLSKQILKSGTSIGANVEEATGGTSKKDFVNKLSIAYKEARETHYWLRLLKETDYLNIQMFKSLENDSLELCKILFSIIRTSKK
jgi:four helix bundle protein